MRTKLVLTLAALAIAGCSSSTPTARPVPASIQARGGFANIDRSSADYQARLGKLREQAGRGDFRTRSDLDAAVMVAAEAHVADRIARGDVVGTREDMLAYLISVWTGIAAATADEAAKTRGPNAFEQAVSRVATATKPEQELRQAAVELVAGEEHPPTGAGRERAIRQAMDDIRSELGQRHAASLKAKREAREASLIRQSLSNLSDMPREIRQTAETNVAESRPPLDGGKVRNIPETEVAVRAEEARLRDVIEAARSRIQQQQAFSAAAAQRDAIRRACDVEATVAGDSVVTPYSRRAGVLGSALAGAIQSTSVQERVRSDCYRLNGL